MTACPLAVNTRLPDDIVVTRATEVRGDFNAIGSCLKKEYTYRIYNSRIRNAFFVDRAWFYPKRLDEHIMHACAQQMVGTHDFAALRSVGTETKTTVRTVYYFDITRQGDLIECKVCADGFLYNMVRAMVGTCVYASEGKLSPADLPRIMRPVTALPLDLPRLRVDFICLSFGMKRMSYDTRSQKTG